ncbi:hypothetical protein FJ987_13840 [Mesorhizobium sp. CU2]|uniref:hypothetical protein n=1 Tax=unclassified Mesorhizobium TaxID=325217 RepID=UPI00112AC9A0|nr:MULTISPECIES: hypothetical protein [unclassified Mesorhizobium]TPN74535.1 hypothetical protein FJ988_30390 [Mesorhizobium sp. CU3]TPO14613.1 hypothetical protein FJ987_13840 [Mesorhizobium sp. CU2]
MYHMRASLPLSLLFFVVTGAVFVLQVIPFTGIFLMFAGAMFWSAFLINAGMIGVGAEVATGRVSQWWILLLLIFYGYYIASVVHEHIVLRSLSTAYDAANARLAIPFDANRQSLAFTDDGQSGAWLTQNYDLPVAYSANANFPEGYQSHRMMDAATCAKVPALTSRATPVSTSGFYDGDTVYGMKKEGRFCAVSVPERPDLPVVRVSRREEKISERGLPIIRVTMTVSMPDGSRYQVLGGVAAPLTWMPMPIMGCALNFGYQRWDCKVGFWRNESTPVISGHTRYYRDLRALAQALGLKPVTVEDRKGVDPAAAMARIAAVETETLTHQLENVDAMIDNPVAKIRDWQVDVVMAHREALASRADAIMGGLERAAAAGGRDRYQARDSGRILAQLLANLPRDTFVGFGPRVLALYSKADDKHWLWEAEPLMRRLGDLGPEAQPYLVKPRASATGSAAATSWMPLPAGQNGAWTVKGICKQLQVVRENLLSDCTGEVTRTRAPDGIVTVQFSTGKGMLLFRGKESTARLWQGYRTVFEIDEMAFGGSAPIPASGQCEYGAPYIGQATIHCRGMDGFKAWVATVETDSRLPVPDSEYISPRIGKAYE